MRIPSHYDYISAIPQCRTNLLRWDFVGRTWGLLHNVSSSRPSGGPWEDVRTRAMMTKMLITNTTGKLNAMNASVGHDYDDRVEFGDEILKAADDLLKDLE